jgi:uncharacterized protein (DUF885 family)
MRQGMRDGLMPPRHLLTKVAEEATDVASRQVTQSPFTEPLQHMPATVSNADGARLTAEIKLGLQQVDEIEKRMLLIAKQQGFNDPKSFNAHIFADAHLRGTSGEQVLGLYRKYTNQMYAKLPEYFGSLPKNKLAVVPMEAYRAPHEVPADYSIGAGDGSRPGRINVNEYEPTKRLMLNVEAIAYHEGIPGHHLQFSIAQELTSVPPFRKFHYMRFQKGGRCMRKRWRTRWVFIRTLTANMGVCRI